MLENDYTGLGERFLVSLSLVEDSTSYSNCLLVCADVNNRDLLSRIPIWKITVVMSTSGFVLYFKIVNMALILAINDTL